MNRSKNNGGFKIPEGYFEGLTEKLIGKMADETSVAQKEDGFTVPKDYFETLNDQIKAKIKQKESKVVQLSPYKRYYFAAAAVAAILLVFFGLNLNTKVEPKWDDLVNSEIENYFETNELGLTSYEIAEVLPVDEFDINDILETHLNEDIVIEYLNDNIDDFEDLNLDNDE